MSDLIFTIDSLETNKSAKIAIRTFLGRNKFTKKGYFSGLLKKIDFTTNFDYDNFNNFELQKIKDTLREEDVLQVRNNEYYISVSALERLFEILKDKECFYWYNDKKKYVIIKRVNLVKADLGDMVQGRAISFEEGTISYRDSQIFITIDQSIDNNRNSIKSKRISIKPQPIIMLDKAEQKIRGRLYFLYGKIKVPSNDDNSTIKEIKDKDRLIYRNFGFEKEVIQILINRRLTKSLGNIFVFKSKYTLVSTIDYLIEKGFRVYYFDGKQVVSSSETQYNISYGIDWFSLKVTSSVNDSTYDLSEYIDLDSNKNYVEIENKIVLLPEKINDNKKAIELIEGELKVSKKSLLSAIELSGNNTESEIDFLSDYDKVKLAFSDKIQGTIRPYQITGVKWLKWLYLNGIGGCLADDMGLGKTLQIIALLSEKSIRQEIGKCLVIAPKALLINWLREINKFGDDIEAYIYHESNRNPNEFCNDNKSLQVIITTSATASNDIEILKSQKYSMIIYDEIQTLKNSESYMYKELITLNSDVRIGLSGTPIENNLSELWSIMNLLNPGGFGSKGSFCRKYSECSNISSLRKYIKLFILRRTKSEVLKELPPKVETNIYCDMTEEQEMLYNSILKAIRGEINSTSTRFKIKSGTNIFNYLLYLREVCCHPELLPMGLNVNGASTSGKFEALKIKLESIYKEGHKVIVFSQFTSMLKIIKEWISKKGYTQYYIDGKVNNRQKIVDDFQNSKEGIFLISLKAGGTGLNLTSAKYAIIYDPWWNPAIEKQAADRIYRIGQNNSVTIYKMITANSIEERISELKIIKEQLFEDVIEGLDNNYTITLEELKKLTL